MSLDDLMDVWRSQDAAPLHDVNKTLLHLALRHDETKLQKQRRIERAIIYAASVGVVAVMALFLAMMIYARPRTAMTGWDVAIPIAGAAAALLAGVAIYLNRMGQARREQAFGESLRDQLNRRIAQLEDQATRARVTTELVLAVMGGICPMAIVLLGLRVNQMPFGDNLLLIGYMLFVCVASVAAGVWEIRRQARKDLLPRKRRLEVLLQELDTP